MTTQFSDGLIAALSQTALFSKNKADIETYYDTLIQHMTNNINYALLCAIASNNFDMVKAIVRTDLYDPNFKDEMGGTPLHAWSKSVEMKEYLESVGFHGSD